jgi:transketolase
MADATTVGTSVPELEEAARRIRALVLESVAHAGAGHVGGPLSAADILAALYFRVLRIRPEEPEWEDRDRFILSKGHSTIGLYAAMALRGFFPIEELKTFDALDSRLQGHPDMTVLPGLDMSSGSLGLGFSAGVGMAMGAKTTGRDVTTFVLLGDGECNEGIVWEGAHAASRYRLDNLVAVVDHNKLQQYGWRGQSTDVRISPYEPDDLASRWGAFGWDVREVDGHDMAALVDALEAARAVEGSPVVIVAHTVKGRGVSFMEGDYLWHAKVPDADNLAAALGELGLPEGVLEGGAR